MPVDKTGMTALDYKKKAALIHELKSRGYVTYGNLLSYFKVQFINPQFTDKTPEGAPVRSFVAYMVPAGSPNGGRIVIRDGLDIEATLVSVRHEILHEFLNHEMRLINKLTKADNIDLDTIDGEEREKILEKYRKKLYSNKAFNFAGDFDISNKGYTEDDKAIIRKIAVNDTYVSGLVTEDHHKDWIDLSLEEMYDKLIAEMQEQKQQQQEQEEQGQGEQSDSSDSEGQEGEQDDSQKRLKGKVIHGRLLNPKIFIDRQGKKVEV